MDFKSCKNSKQIQFLMEDLKLAISQKLLSNDELKSLDKKKTCESFQIHAEALLKLASERAAAQSENVAEEEP